MPRSTVDFGIDLGTTNSEIAVFNGTTTEVIKNNENFENTSSAVWINKHGEIRVGRQAKEKHEVDEDNAKIEFKRQMGIDNPVQFLDSGRSMLPEELSAEVLKQLKANVRQFLNEDISAAVITVPAGFNPAQVEATNRAARLAGLSQSPLVQEPVAAAMAYGFHEKSSSERSRWLVYDFRGGTFDAVLIRKNDGLIQVENSSGNNLLGGKNIDSAIITELLVPSLKQKASLKNFSRQNPKYAPVFAKLKIQAEIAKIQLSREYTYSYEFEKLCEDDDGKWVDFELEIKRAELEALAEPFIAKTINICKAMLDQSRIGPGDVEKLILVGGPTLMPYLRERLSNAPDHIEFPGLGIPLEYRVDPFTVVARGAAIYAGSLPLKPTGPTKTGEFQIRLDYKAISPETDPYVSGQVVSPEIQDFSGFSIEFVNKDARPPWRSGLLGLTPEGHFMATLWAEKGTRNIFEINVANPQGTRQKTTPADFPYTISEGGADAQTLIHNIGVGLADNSVFTFFEKGKRLPARARHVLTTTFDAKRGSNKDAIKVPVLSGNQERADRNQTVGLFEISARDFQRDVPAGSDVEVTIEVDESRTFTTKIYIPILDEEFEKELIGTTSRASVPELASAVEKEKARLQKLRDDAQKTGDPLARKILQRIDGERLEHDVDTSLADAQQDQDAGDVADSRLRDLQIALDAVEDVLKWPNLVTEAESNISFAKEIVEKHGTTTDKMLLDKFTLEVHDAIQKHDPVLLETRSGELWGFAFRLWKGTPDFELATFYWLQGQKDQMKDPGKAESLIALGSLAINSNNLSGLQDTNNQLRQLLAPGQQVPPKFGGSTLGRRI
jgi:molecular chaperone DnaK